MFPENLTFSIAGWVNTWVDALVSNYGDVFRHISDTLLWAIVSLENLLRLTPWWLMLLIVGVIAWHATRKVVSSVLIVGLLFLVGAVGLWDKLMQTLALVMVVIASMIGARGLGENVLVGIQTLNVGKGLEAGLAIVILAVVIDRITQAYGRPRHGAKDE